MSDMLERWPGYNEQSWSERFAELDRRYHAERQNSIKALLELHEARVAIESRVRAEERERAARIAEAFSRDMFERCAASGWNDDEASCLGWHGKNIAAAIRSGDAG